LAKVSENSNTQMSSPTHWTHSPRRSQVTRSTELRAEQANAV
jgi:hypothetical protein